MVQGCKRVISTATLQGRVGGGGGGGGQYRGVCRRIGVGLQIAPPPPTHTHTHTLVTGGHEGPKLG